METRPGPEANVPGQSRPPHESGGQEPSRSTNSWVRDSVKSKEQLLTKNLWNQRMGRTRGNITEDGGLMERDGDNGEGRAG